MTKRKPLRAFLAEQPDKGREILMTMAQQLERADERHDLPRRGLEGSLEAIESRIDNTEVSYEVDQLGRMVSLEIHMAIPPQ